MFSRLAAARELTDLCLPRARTVRELKDTHVFQVLKCLPENCIMKRNLGSAHTLLSIDEESFSGIKIKAVIHNVCGLCHNMPASQRGLLTRQELCNMSHRPRYVSCHTKPWPCLELCLDFEKMVSVRPKSCKYRVLITYPSQRKDR